MTHWRRSLSPNSRQPNLCLFVRGTYSRKGSTSRYDRCQPSWQTIPKEILPVNFYSSSKQNKYSRFPTKFQFPTRLTSPPQSRSANGSIPIKIEKCICLKSKVFKKLTAASLFKAFFANEIDTKVLKLDRFWFCCKAVHIAFTDFELRPQSAITSERHPMFKLDNADANCKTAKNKEYFDIAQSKWKKISKCTFAVVECISAQVDKIQWNGLIRVQSGSKEQQEIAKK